jgi:hypothetical protein
MSRRPKIRHEGPWLFVGDLLSEKSKLYPQKNRYQNQVELYDFGLILRNQPFLKFEGVKK